ncbi:hypothetical protein Sar04_47390 [Salinispora arenicola]|uniref:Uncharacterized protein n=1 Tax=Salinispora arenicola TaxID=168697 RepID=A0ABQ4K0K1_SALAC|nr:hypothetical protein Sar04_47390 [Salinispora arenicola]
MAELAAPGDEAVQDNGSVPGVDQCRGDGAADESGSARNEYLHAMSSTLKGFVRVRWNEAESATGLRDPA